MRSAAIATRSKIGGAMYASKYSLVFLILMFSVGAKSTAHGANNEVAASASGAIRTAGHGSSLCPSILRDFRTNLLQQIESTKQNLLESQLCFDGLRSGRRAAGQVGSRSDSRSSVDCITRINRIEEEVTANRSTVRKLRAEIAREWLTRQPSQALVQSCISQGQDGRPQLETNGRLLRVSDRVRCQALSTSWGHELSGLEAQYITRENIPGMTQAELSRLRNFRESPIARLLPEHVKSGENVSRRDTLISLRDGFSQLVIQANRIERRIRDLPEYQLYKLYSFQHRFTEFASSLGDRSDAARSCFSNDGIIRDCLRGASFYGCVSRSYDFLSPLIPIVNVIEGYGAMVTNRAAYNTGVASLEEYSSGAASAGLEVIAGLSVAGAIGRGVRQAAATRSARVVQENNQVLEFGPRNHFSGYSEEIIRPNSSRVQYVQTIDGKQIWVDTDRIGGHPMLVASRDLEVFGRLAEGRPVRGATPSADQDLIEYRETIRRAGPEEVLSRIRAARRNPEFTIDGQNYRVFDNSGAPARRVSEADWETAPAFGRDILTGAQTMRIRGYDFVRVDSERAVYRNRGITYSRDVDPLHGARVGIVSNDGRVIQGNYISAGGPHLRPGMSPNHAYDASQVRVHFIEIDGQTVAIPAENTQIFRRTSR